MSNLVLRSITGFFFGLVVIGSILLGAHSQFVVFGIFLSLGLWEYAQLFRNSEFKQNPLQSLIIGGIIYCLLFFYKDLNLSLNLIVAIIFSLIFLSFILELWRKQILPIHTIAIFIFGLVYLVVPFVLMNKLTEFSTFHFPPLLGMILLIWANDTFAYLTGRKMGKTPLFERISPKKTWEGTVGGILMTIFTGFLIFYFSNSYSLIFWLFAAIIVAPCAILGDLIESLFKRSLNIKDSGNILPGHGGILDRFDAVLFTVPFFYLWILIYQTLK